MNAECSCAELRLRKLTPNDTHKIFQWRNSDFIRNLGAKKNKVTWEEHQKWIERYFKGKDRLLLIIENGGEPIGQIRFDPCGKNHREAFVSIYLTEGNTAKGLGVKAMLMALPKAFSILRKVTVVLALVRKSNRPSVRLFEKCLFERKVGKGNTPTSKKGFLIFSYRKSEKFVIPHNKLSFDKEEVTAVVKVIKSGRWCVGDTVKSVEEELCKLTGRKHCILVGSGIAALRLSLLALGVRENDFVALPAYSCVALANAALSLGANIIPLDIEKESLNLQSACLSTIENSDAKVAVCVHTFGNPCQIAKTAKLKTIEDCSHGLLRSRMGRLADLAVISFYATKFIAGGMGGAILTDDESVAERVLDNRDYDDKPTMRWRLNDKISDIHAAIVKAQLSKIKSIIAKREQAALRYFELFEPLTKILEDMGLELPNFSSERVWYRFPIRLKNKDINFFIEKMSGFKINVARPITCWVKNPEQFPEANSAYKEIVSLPFFPTITYEEQRYVSRKTIEVLNSYE